MSDQVSTIPNESKKQAVASTSKKIRKSRYSFRARLFTLGKDLALEDMSWTKAFLKFFKPDLLLLKRGWLSVCVISLLLTYGGILVAGKYYGGKIETESSTSSELRGKLDESIKNQIILRQERDTYLIQLKNTENSLAPWVNLAQSHVTNTPLTQRMDVFLDMVKEQLKAPAFSLYINGALATNGMLCKIDTNRIIQLSIRNVGFKAAERLGVNIKVKSSDLLTNLIANHWGIQPGGFLLDGDKIKNDDNTVSWSLTADSIIHQGDSFLAHPLIVSTNFSRREFPSLISISSDRLNQRTNFYIQFELPQ
ncbi:MAG TPA: hypothetical protein VGH19_04405 [Verrucomicrobiae bacterium]